MSTTYYVNAVWDAEASVYYSESNIPGLVVEADTLAEFVAIAEELAPEMLRDNVFSVGRVGQGSIAAAELRYALA